VSGREGSYPPPPCWPARLTHSHATFAPRFIDVMALVETHDEVRHVYLADGYPGPCVTEWSGDAFLDWHPCLTIERAERLAEGLAA